jgi:hypothetical protein
MAAQASRLPACQEQCSLSGAGRQVMNVCRAETASLCACWQGKVV